MSKALHTHKLHRAARRIATFTATLLVVGAAGMAVFLGSNALAERADSTQSPAQAPRAQVSVTPVVAQAGYTVHRRFVGQFEAAAVVDLSFELGGQLVEVTVDEGAHVAKGKVIGRLDTALLEAEDQRLAASKATTQARLTLAAAQLERSQRLRSEGHVSQAALDQAQASFDELRSVITEIDAARGSIQINLDKSILYAPFDGQVGNRFVDRGATLAAGQVVATVIATSEPRLRVGLPLSLDRDAIASASIEVEGVRVPARLLQLRPDIDPLTRTRIAVFAFDGVGEPVFGATGALVLETTVEAAGTWIPVDALQEGARGVWTVLVVDSGQVRNASVEVLHTEATRAYVRGTFAPGARVIVTGAHRVVPGQAVDVIAGLG